VKHSSTIRIAEIVLRQAGMRERNTGASLPAARCPEGADSASSVAGDAAGAATSATTQHASAQRRSRRHYTAGKSPVFCSPSAYQKSSHGEARLRPSGPRHTFSTSRTAFEGPRRAISCEDERQAALLEESAEMLLRYCSY